jgi:hypothetical protein
LISSIAPTAARRAEAPGGSVGGDGLTRGSAGPAWLAVRGGLSGDVPAIVRGAPAARVLLSRPVRVGGGVGGGLVGRGGSPGRGAR